MVRRDTFINKIRELGYTYKGQQKRTYLWRKVGGSHRMFVPMAELLEEEFVANALRQAGLTDQESRAFISSHATST
jgi:hypothetical protein